MNVTINSNAFTKLEKMVGLSVVGIKVSDYRLQDQELSGNVKIYGEYYTEEEEYEKNNGLKEFENLIPFEIVFSKEDPIIEEIDIENFEYYEVAGRGIEASFDLVVEYVVNDKEENEDEYIEEVKEQLTREIDELLEEKLEVRNDNFLEEVRKQPIDENMATIKVIYYDKNQEVKDICQKHNVSYYDILEENKKYHFNDNYRIIISESNGNK